MKRFLLFAGEDYYPIGGWNDFLGDFDTVAEAKGVGEGYREGSALCWWHVVDTEAAAIVTYYGDDDAPPAQPAA